VDSQERLKGQIKLSDRHFDFNLLMKNTGSNLIGKNTFTGGWERYIACR
jgi:hypothetical protein